MHKSSFVRARIEPSLKDIAEDILEELGISPTQAITMLYKRIARDQAWPMELKIPNAETRKALEEVDKEIGLIDCTDEDDLFNKIGF